MAALNQQLRRFFLIIAGIGLLLLVFALIDLWRNVVDRHLVRQQSQIATLFSATRNVLASQEVVLDLLGRELLLDDPGQRGDRARQLLDRVRQLNPRVAGYGLASPDGELVQVNSLFDRDRLPNLREFEPTQASFDAALASPNMVIGRAYLMPALGQWVIPLRKAIRNDSGEVLGVMTTGLALDGPAAFFSGETYLGPGNTIQIVRDDLYPLYRSSAEPHSADYFDYPVPQELFEQAVASAEQSSGMTFEQIRSSGKTVPFQFRGTRDTYIASAEFDPAYDYWIMSQTRRSRLLGEFARTATVYVAIYLLLILVIFSMLRTITRTERMRRAELEHRADHDVLTDLPNRQRMGRDFEMLSRMNSGGIGLLFIDLDNFKSFNDGFGHAMGDELLHRVAARLRQTLESGECAARIGGDEFVVLHTGTDEAKLAERAQALIEKISDPIEFKDMRCQLACSIGIAVTCVAGNDLNDMLRAADIALFEAKKHRNSWCFYRSEMGSRYLENIRIEQHLREAVDRDAMQIAYQPQFDMHGRLIGLEALARWHDEELGEIEPSRFIAIAEASGLIVRLGDYLIDKTFTELGRLDSERLQDLNLSINISVRQFLAEEFGKRLLELRDRAQLVRCPLVLEITESLFMEDLGQIVDQLEQLRLNSIHISLDDFGTGFSALSRLKDLPVDELKIDKSFIDTLEHDPYSRRLVKSIIAIGKTHNMKLLAEGVETRAQFEMLKEDGCDAVQGFLFARPMSIAALQKFLEQPRPNPIALTDC